MNPVREIAASLAKGLRVLTSEPRYLVYALLVHAGFFAMFVLSFEWTKTVRPEPPGEVVQAVLVDEAQVQREIDKLKEAEARKAAEEAERQRRQREAEESRKREEQRLAEIKRQQEQATRQAEESRKREEQRLAEIKQEQERTAKQAAEQRKREEQRLAELKKQEEEARKREEQRQAEERKRQEESRKLEEQRLAEQRRQEEEARRLADEQRRRDEQAAAERARREQSEVDRYVRMIQQQVARAWIRPPNWAGQQCIVRVNLIPGGDVVAVSMVRSCGDAVLDRSVESAVRRAAPLQVPPADSGLFDRFRELEFVFKPEP